MSRTERRLAPPFGPAPTPPATLTPRERHAYASGWYAASEGDSINTNPYRQRDMCDSWDDGHRAYYDEWLAHHRVRACDRDAGGMAA